MVNKVLRLPVGIRYPLEKQPLFRESSELARTNQEEINSSFLILNRHFVPSSSQHKAASLLSDFKDYVVTLDQIADGSVELFGSKLTGLAKLHSLGCPIPSAVGIGSPVVARLFDQPDARSLLFQFLPYVVADIERETRHQYQARGLNTPMSFGDPKAPLLLIIRSGAERVIEGLLPTLQYVGLNDQTVWGLASSFNDPKRAHELYRQFIIDYSCIVIGLEPSLFRKIKPVTLSTKKLRGLKNLLSEALRDTRKTRAEKINMARGVVSLVAEIEAIKNIIRSNARRSFPQDPFQQLAESILAISRAWNDEHIVTHRSRNGMKKIRPAAITIQRQEHGKFVGKTSGAGIVFTSDPATGVSRDPQTGSPIGWAMFSSTGDEVMSGHSAVATHREKRSYHQRVSLRHLLFRLDRSEAELIKSAIQKMKSAYRRPMKVEVIVNHGKVWFVQGAPAQLTPLAMVRTLVDWYKDQSQEIQVAPQLSPSEIRKLIADMDLWDTLAQPQYERPTQGHFLLTGTSHFPGAVQGPAILDYRTVLLRKPLEFAEREFIFIIDSIDDSREWSEIFLRAKGIVFRREPGMHFLQRAIDEKVPVIVATDQSLIGEGLKSLKPKTLVIFDSTRNDGFVTQDLDLPLKQGTVANFVKNLLSGPMTADYIESIQKAISRREAEAIQYIWEFYQIVPPFQSPRFLAEVLPGRPSDILDRVIHYEIPIPRLMPLRELVVQQGWVVDDEADSRPMDYDLNEEGKKFFRAFFEMSSAMLADLLLKTTIGEHSFAIEIFQSLSRAQQIQIMNLMSDAAKDKNFKPGWTCGIFLISRFLAVWIIKKTKDQDLIQELTSEALAFLLQELFIFDLNVHPRKCLLDESIQNELKKYSLTQSKNTAMIRRITREESATIYLQQRWVRYPGLNPTFWIPALERHPKFLEVFENLPHVLKIWWEEIKNLV